MTWVSNLPQDLVKYNLRELIHNTNQKVLTFTPFHSFYLPLLMFSTLSSYISEKIWIRRIFYCMWPYVHSHHCAFFLPDSPRFLFCYFLFIQRLLSDIRLGKVCWGQTLSVFLHLISSSSLKDPFSGYRIPGLTFFLMQEKYTTTQLLL